LRNPVAWFLLALLVAASYWNFEHLKELDAVCEAIEIPPLLPYEPKTDLEKAQAICADRQDAVNNPPRRMNRAATRHRCDMLHISN
jgi:hypothetical protein